MASFDVNQVAMGITAFETWRLSFARVLTGLKTCCFCDGNFGPRVAARRVPSEVWADGQCTPLCTRCDREKGYCRFAVVHTRVLHLRVSESAMSMAKSIFWDRSFRADTIRAPSVSDPFGACTAFWALALM